MEDKPELATVRYIINGVELSLEVKPDMEKVFRDAGEVVKEQIIELTKKHSYRYNSTQIAILAAIEAMVNVINIHQEYNKFQEEINSYLDGLAGNVA